MKKRRKLQGKEKITRFWTQMCKSRRHDLWVVSSDPMFMFHRTSHGKGVSDRRHKQWIAVFCSAWHGITKEGKVQLDLLSKQRPWHTCNRVYAIRGPSVSLEMQLWEALDHTDLISETLMQALITPCPKNKGIQSAPGKHYTRFQRPMRFTQMQAPIWTP